MATISYSWGFRIPSFGMNELTPHRDDAIAATGDGGYLGAWSVGSGFVRGRTSTPTARRVPKA